ncbi:MAG: PIN domain-containing protein [Rhodoferax sp.]|nr:PIN domain-containing protein [Rhodoferax sp.]
MTMCTAGLPTFPPSFERKYSHGHDTQQTRSTRRALLDVCQLVSVNAAVADEAARIRRETGLKLPDALIAATALLQAAKLVTANARDFGRVPGLELIES